MISNLKGFKISGFFTKPVNIEALKAKIHYILASKLATVA